MLTSQDDKQTVEKMEVGDVESKLGCLMGHCQRLCKSEGGSAASVCFLHDASGNKRGEWKSHNFFYTKSFSVGTKNL